MRRSTLARAAIAAMLAGASALAFAAATSVEIGTTDSLIQSLQTQHLNPGIRFTQAIGNESLAVDIRDFYDRDGKVSISGHAMQSKDSVFFIKGSRKKLHGFLALHNKKTAYEFTTDAKGVVSVTEVSINKVYPDFDEAFHRTNPEPGVNATFASPVYSPMALKQAVHIGRYADQDVTKLQSKPGSSYVFYLNTTAVMSGSTPANGVSKEAMYRMWQSVADQYSMYKLNVTTDRAVYDAAKAANITRTGVINLVNQDGRSFAPLHSFGTTSAGTLYRNPGNGEYGYGIGMTGAHEVGHQMGMAHDGGGSGGEYFEGLPAFQWGPIMGNYWMGGSWANAFFTWSKGEYNTATNREDDLNIMNVDEAVPYEDDDNVSGKSLVIGSGGEVNPASNWGRIERTSDTDTFTFTVGSGGGTLDLRIDPIEYLRMLDVDATIVDASGKTVAHSNLPVHRSAEFKALALPAGSYKLVIQGGAEGTPQAGFSKYSSLGYYAMQGTIKGAGGGGGTPMADFGFAAKGLSVTFTDKSTDQGGTIGTYAWNFGDGSTGNTASPTHTYAKDGTYTVSLTVTDADNKKTSTKSQSVSVSATATGPVANFSFTQLKAPARTIKFIDTSTTTGGATIATRAWNFGDGKKASTPKPNHTYAKVGTYTVSETVTDSNGKSATKSQSVVVK